MKEFLKEWGIPATIAIIAIPLYLYFNNSNFSYQVDKALDEPPYLTIQNNALYIDEFKFTVGVTGINQVSGDFEKLNEKVYDLLKGKSGKYAVFLKANRTDRYGNTTSEYQSYGSIDADELNKYKSSKYWGDAGGLQPILTGNEISTDTAEVVENTPAMDTDTPTIDSLITPTTQNIAPTTQNFHFNSMIAKPWSYYDVSSGEMNELTLTDNGITEAIQYWQEFIDDIKDIDVECKSRKAAISITTTSGVSEFVLNKVNENSYNLEGNPSIALHIISPTVCKVFFMSEGSCVSVTNKPIKI